jgi:predicted mannosyl-3-phosphoglycerate phosphatase (HAD superfamily)
MLVLTCVDGALRNSAVEPHAAARQVVAELGARGVPVILTSPHSRTELESLQHALALDEPFIAEAGGVLSIPSGYFTWQPRLAQPRREVLEFHPPSIAAAIDTLMWFYRVSGDSPLLVGVGTSKDDQPLLRHVDIPVLIRNPSVDQRPLRSQFPDAYVTPSTGLDGWNEALVGVSLADADVPGA